MAANRKLQTEIQQVLKKVDEGVELFDEIWGKVYAAEQQSLKEKYENDLKKEIKKLQRLRDQIKSWISSNDIKDKAPLVEARKVIESKMEMFKVCEKDTKTKAYSKEGLAREARIDPKDQMKEDKRNWLNDCLDKLHDLNTIVDGEKEKLSGGKSKLKNKEMLERLDNRIQKHKWHISRIELIIRLLENDELDPSLLDSIKDSLEYYLETAAEDDGALGVEHEFDIYEDLQLDEYVKNIEVAKGHLNEHDSEKDPDEQREMSKPPATKPVVIVKVSDSKPTPKTEVTPKAEVDDAKVNNVTKPTVIDHDHADNKTPPVSIAKSVKTEPITKNAEAPLPTLTAVQSNPQSMALSTTSAPIVVVTTPPVQPSSQLIPPTSTVSAQATQPNPTMSLELQAIYNQLKQSSICTLEHDSERNSYAPKNYYGGCHSSFPNAPALNGPSELVGLFDKLPLDTLFFGFYYQQNSLPQYLAAKRLKKTSWRFHKKYTTWFQRHSEPKNATPDFEEGTYIYFDYESGWCQRIKSDFKFEYAFLEDEI